MGETAAFTSAGTKLYICASAPATFDQTGYELLTFTQIKDITNLGALGREYAVIPHKPLDSRQIHKFKGSFDEGGLQLEMGWAPADAGQILLAAGLASDSDYYFKLEFNDNPGGTSNTIFYFPAKVMSSPKNIGEADSITTQSCQILINGTVVEIAKVT